MPREIERKFLVTGDAWRESEGHHYRQGYLSLAPEHTVRVRLAEDTAVLTIKGETKGATRREFEYEIPSDDARQMLDELCEKPVIAKKRRLVDYQGHTWEVDEFFAENDGLVVAELELESEDESFPRPPWLGEEVTDDPRYYNANLVQRPYNTWEE
jgi:adenylate cyclase